MLRLDRLPSGKIRVRLMVDGVKGTGTFPTVGCVAVCRTTTSLEASADGPGAGVTLAPRGPPLDRL